MSSVIGESVVEPISFFNASVETHETIDAAQNLIAPVNVGADDKLASLRMTGAMAEFRVQGQQSRVDQDVAASAARVQEVNRREGAEAAASVLAEETQRLNARHGTIAGDRLMETLIKEDSRELVSLLRFTDKLTNQQRTVVAQALGRGFDRITDSTQRTAFAQDLAYATTADAFMPGTHDATRLGQLVALSGSANLKRLAVTQMMNVARTIKPGLLGDNGGLDLKALFNSAAHIAETSDSSLRATLFAEITKGLTADNIKTLAKESQLKDRLSTLFMANAQNILHAQAPDGRYLDAAFMEGLTKFFELTLFTKNPGALRSQLMESVVIQMSDIGDVLANKPPLSEADYAAKHGGWSQIDHVGAMGGFAAMVAKAADNQKGALKADAAARKETAKMLAGLAFAFMPGAKDAIGTLAAEGAGWLEKLPDKMAELAWKQGQGLMEKSSAEALYFALGRMTDEEALKNVDTLLERVKGTAFTVYANLPNGEAGEGANLSVVFAAAYAFYYNVSK